MTVGAFSNFLIETNLSICSSFISDAMAKRPGQKQ